MPLNSGTRMSLDCTSNMGATCAKAFEQFLQAFPEISPMATASKVQILATNVDPIERILLSSTTNEKWIMNQASNLLFLMLFSVFLLLITLYSLADDIDARQALREERWPTPKREILAAFIILLARTMNDEAGIAFCLVFSCDYLYKLRATQQRQRQEDEADLDFPYDDYFQKFMQDFWRPLLACAVLGNVYVSYKRFYFVDSTGERSWKGFMEFVFWTTFEDESWTAYKGCEFFIGVVALALLWFDPSTPLGEDLHFAVNEFCCGVKERVMEYMYAIGAIVDRLRGKEAENEVVRHGGRLGLHAEVDRNLLGYDMLGFGH